MKVTRETVYGIQLGDTEAGQLERSLSRIMEALDKLPAERYSRLVSLGDVDQLLALRTELRNATHGARRPAQATLPKSLENVTIGAMAAGQHGYTVPWAMIADLDGKMWLSSSHTLSPDRGGTHSMYVERRADGYHVWPDGKRAYTPERRLTTMYRWFPVAELHTVDRGNA